MISKKLSIKKRFVNAVFNINVEDFRKLLDTEIFDEELFSKFPIEDDENNDDYDEEDYVCEIECPIYWISQCWDLVIGKPENWKHSSIVAKRKNDNLEIMRLFRERLNVNFESIDFYNSEIHFFRNYPEDSFYDVFLEDEEKILANHKKIDAELYVAVNKFDYQTVEELLQAGANPRVEIDDDTNCWERIGMHTSFLCVNLQHILLSDEKSLLDYEYFSHLFDWAAHEKMWSLLEKYDKE